MGLRRNRGMTVTAVTEEELPPELRELLGGIVSQLDLGRSLQQCHEVWSAADAFVGFCPAWDHLVVLLDTVGEISDGMVDLTADALDDFEHSVMPLIAVQQEILFRLRREDLKSRRAFYLASAWKELRSGSNGNGSMSRLEEIDVVELETANAAVMEGLRSFLERHPAVKA